MPRRFRVLGSMDKARRKSARASSRRKTNHRYPNLFWLHQSLSILRFQVSVATDGEQVQSREARAAPRFAGEHRSLQGPLTRWPSGRYMISTAPPRQICDSQRTRSLTNGDRSRLFLALRVEWTHLDVCCALSADVPRATRMTQFLRVAEVQRIETQPGRMPELSGCCTLG
jgi:hypothetical protein